MVPSHSHPCHTWKQACNLSQPNEPTLSAPRFSLVYKLGTPSCRLSTETTVSTNRRQDYTNYCQDCLQRFTSNWSHQVVISFDTTFFLENWWRRFDTTYHDLGVSTPMTQTFSFSNTQGKVWHWPTLAKMAWPNHSYYNQTMPPNLTSLKECSAFHGNALVLMK